MFGSSGRTRTADQVINSHLLYRLSYRGRVAIVILKYGLVNSYRDYLILKLPRPGLHR